MKNCSENILPPSVGSKLKMAVTANLGEVHMSEVDFECVFFRNGGRSVQKIAKSEMSYVSDDEYLAIVDTDMIGGGEYFMKFTAWIPDADMDGGLRSEVVIIPTGIRVNS